jgi:predicted nuclease with TOPRIM domain
MAEQHDLIARLRQLESANIELRKIHHDQRGHLEALRDEVRSLRDEVSRLMVDRESLEAENALLRKSGFLM